jgi:hypothetical protein
MTRSLPRWVHQNPPRIAPPDSWRSLRDARVPPVHYLDKPPRRNLEETSLNPGVQFSMSKRVQFRTSVDNKAERNGSRHPCVKPVALMRHLVRLVTPPGGLVLDPFAGTGTTGEAAQLEGFDYLLIEREPEYVRDCERRLARSAAPPAPPIKTPPMASNDAACANYERPVSMTVHIPVPIEENEVYRDFRLFGNSMRRLCERRINSLFCPGPPGVGKSFTAEQIAREYGLSWNPEKPGTPKGLLEILFRYKDAVILVFDDIDHLLKNTTCLQWLMCAFDTKSPRIISHTVGSDFHSFMPFEIKCAVLFLSNLDFDDPRLLSRNGMPAFKNRSLLAPISHDPLSNYEYCGWVATRPGGLLDTLRVDMPIGSIVRGGRASDYYEEELSVSAQPGREKRSPRPLSATRAEIPVAQYPGVGKIRADAGRREESGLVGDG